MIKIDDNRTLPILVLVFALNPIVGILLTTFWVLGSSTAEVDRKKMMCLFLMLATYMGLLNATKTPASDQVQYMHAYMLVSDQNLWQSLTNIYGQRYNDAGTTKEMGYGLLNIVGYYVSFGYYPLFILEFTILLYMLCFMSIKRLFRVIRPTYWQTLTVASVYIMCFYSQYFNLTVHLQRQEIATAVMLFSIVDYCVSEEYTWKRFLVPLFAITLHTSVGLFLPLFCVRKIFKNNIERKQLLIILGICLLLVGASVTIAGSLLSALGGDFYALDRLSNAGESIEESFNYNFIFSISLPLLLIVGKNVFSKKQNTNNTPENIFYLFFLVVVIFYMLIPDTTMQYRYFMMSYSFWPFVIPLLFKKKSLYSSVTLSMICVFFFFRFFLTFDSMVWHYTSVDNALACNAISLFMKNPF